MKKIPNDTSLYSHRGIFTWQLESLIQL